MWIKFIMVVIACHKKYFHIIIEPAPNLNKTKIYFSAFFCWIRDILNFKSARLKVNSLTFYKNVFFIESRFITNFFSEWVQARPSLRGPGRARTPIRWKNSLWNDSRWKKRFCEKSRNLPWVELIWNSKCLEFCKQAEK